MEEEAEGQEEAGGQEEPAEPTVHEEPEGDEEDKGEGENKEHDASPPLREVVSSLSRGGVYRVTSDVGDVEDNGFEDEIKVRREMKELQQQASASITEILSDVIEPVGEEWTGLIQVTLDTDEVATLTASAKKTVKDDVVIKEMEDLGHMYKHSQIQNHHLLEQNRHLLEYIQRLENRIAVDPRIMKILRITDAHRKEKDLLLARNKQFCSDLFDLNMEVKRLNDTVRDQQEKLVQLNKLREKMKALEEELKQKESARLLTTTQDMTDKDQESSSEKSFLEAMVNAERKSEYIINDWKAKLNNLFQKNQETLSERDQLLHTVDSLKATVAKKEYEVKKSGEKVASSLKTVSHYSSQNKKMKKRVLGLKSTCGKLQNRIKTLQLVVKNGKLSFASCKSKSEELKKDFKKTVTENVQCKKNFKMSQRALLLKSKDTDNLEQEMERLKSHIAQLTANIAKAQKLTYDKTKECSALKVLNRQLESVSHRNLIIMENIIGQSISMKRELNGLKEDKWKLLKQHTNFTSKIEALQSFINQIVADANESHTLSLNLQTENSKYLQQMRYDEKVRKVQRRMISELTAKNIAFRNTTHSLEELKKMMSSQLQVKAKECEGLQVSVASHVIQSAELERRTEAQRVHINEQDVKIKDLESNIADLKETVSSLRKDSVILNENLGKASSALIRSKRDAEELRVQRDLFGAKYLEKKTELSLLSEREKAAERVIKNSNIEFRNLRNDTSILKLEVKNLRRKLKISEEKCHFNTELKSELCIAQRSLIMTANKAKALELEPNRNMHRWKHMEIKDPSRYELVLKVQNLTRKLIWKTTECTEKEKSIKEKDFHFYQLQTLLCRRSDPSLSSEASLFRDTIRKKNRQLKALTAELNIKSDDLRRSKKVVEEQKEKIDKQFREEVASKRRKNAKPKQVNERKGVNNSSSEPLRLPAITPKLYGKSCMVSRFLP